MNGAFFFFCIIVTGLPPKKGKRIFGYQKKFNRDWKHDGSEAALTHSERGPSFQHSHTQAGANAHTHTRAQAEKTKRGEAELQL